jgi:hypothetical protein
VRSRLAQVLGAEYPRLRFTTDDEGPRLIPDDSAGDPKVRFRFVHNGEAYVVGNVLIEHGNRYDVWNQINYSTLRQECSMLSRRLRVSEEQREDRYFVVPAGTYLVIHFMNRIKSRYRFVDLLKPETKTVIPLLLTLEWDHRPTLEQILQIGPVAKRRLAAGTGGDHQPLGAGELAAEGEALAPGAVGAGDMVDSGSDSDMVEENSAAGRPDTPTEPARLLEEFVPETNMSVDRVLLEVLSEKDAVLFGVAAPTPGQDLNFIKDAAAKAKAAATRVTGKARAAAAWLRAEAGDLAQTARSLAQAVKQAGIDKISAAWRDQIRAALRALNQDDCSFSLMCELEDYKGAARKAANEGGFEVVVYGHTHLPKKVPLGPNQGGPWYFNTGTWCDVMQLPQAILGNDDPESKKALNTFLAAVKVNDYQPYVRRYLTFLEIEIDPNKERGETSVVKAELYSYGGPGHERSEPLQDIRDLQKGKVPCTKESPS